MSLVVIPSKLSQSSDCLTLYTQDSTGLYNATTNTGGYGTPNPLYTDITAITLRMGRPNSSTTIDITLDGSSTPTAIQYANQTGGYPYPFTSINIGQSTTSEALTDGVYPLQEFVAYFNLDSDTEVTATNGSTSVYLSGGGFTFDINCNYIQLPDGEFYEVASFTSSTSAILVEPYAGTTETSNIWSNVYSGSASLITYCNAQTCMTNILGNEFVADATADCSDCKKETNQTAQNAFYEFYILKANEACSDTESFALNIVTYNEKYCNGGSSNCGCNN
jgi:hypothetical protein